MIDNPYLQGPYAPVDREVEVEGLEHGEVIGQIPTDVDGTYVRNGPNPKHPPKGRYHWFDGDGMLHAVTLRAGRVSYRNRWIKTEHLARDEAAGHALWTGLMEPATNNPPGALYKDTGNTDVVFDGRDLLSLWYIAGKAHRVDPVTLETRGPATFGGERPIKMSAHAKVDRVTSETMFFDYGPRPPYMSYGVIGKEGTITHFTDIDLPGPRLPHDMAFTENYSILMDLPVFFRPEALKQRRWMVDFHEDMPARFGILPRHGHGRSIRWFEAETCYVYHVVNAWEEGSTIVMVGCRDDDPIPEIDPRDGELGRMLANLRLHARLYEWRFDLETGKTTERAIDDRSSEFPSMDKRRAGRKSRYAYNMTIPKTRTFLFDGIVKYDLQTGTSQTFEFGEGVYGSEAPFAPRRGATEEDDGYLLSYVIDARTDRSALWIFDAREIGRGPVAKVPMPERVPLGFHATWVDASELRTQAS